MSWKKLYSYFAIYDRDVRLAEMALVSCYNEASTMVILEPYITVKQIQPQNATTSTTTTTGKSSAPEHMMTNASKLRDNSILLLLNYWGFEYINLVAMFILQLN